MTRMTMPPGLRKAVLTTHIASSVGWLGAVLTYLGLDVAAAASTDADTARSAYTAMGLTVFYVIVPLALTSLVIGIVNALGTTWGLFRHYWVLVKLLLTLVATTILLLEAPTVRHLADAAASGADPRELSSTLAHSIGGAVLLLTTTLLSVYKPRGLTRYGWHKQREQRRRARTTATSPSS